MKDEKATSRRTESGAECAKTKTKTRSRKRVLEDDAPSSRVLVPLWRRTNTPRTTHQARRAPYSVLRTHLSAYRAGDTRLLRGRGPTGSWNRAASLRAHASQLGRQPMRMRAVVRVLTSDATSRRKTQAATSSHALCVGAMTGLELAAATAATWTRPAARNSDEAQASTQTQTRTQAQVRESPVHDDTLANSSSRVKQARQAGHEQPPAARLTP